MQYWLTTGFPKEKLILGLPTYGNSFTLESASKVNLGASTTGPGNAGPNTGSPGTLAYYEVILTKWSVLATIMLPVQKGLAMLDPLHDHQ